MIGVGKIKQYSNVLDKPLAKGKQEVPFYSSIFLLFSFSFPEFELTLLLYVFAENEMKVMIFVKSGWNQANYVRLNIISGFALFRCFRLNIWHRELYQFLHLLFFWDLTFLVPIMVLYCYDS